MSFGRPYWGTIVVVLSLSVVLQVVAVLGALALSRATKWPWILRGTVVAFAGVAAIPIVNRLSEPLYPILFDFLSQARGYL